MQVGGVGSGRSSCIRRRATTEDFHKLDLRYLVRSGLLEVGQISSIRWATGGKVNGGITLRALSGVVELDYRVRKLGREWERKQYSINLVTTASNLGGSRLWFECPNASCRKRAAILYGGETFVCRKCRNLAYPSQCLPRWERAMLKADRIRDRLNWKPGIFNRTSLEKPKGMHWKTYKQLISRYCALANEGFDGLKDLIGYGRDKS